jgi:hypothetical protein
MGNPSQSNLKRVVPEDRSKNKRWILWLTGGCLLICILLAVGIGWFLGFLGEVEDVLDGEISFPRTIKVGDEFDFVITVTNPTTDSIFVHHIVIHNTLTDTDIPPKIWEGVNIPGTEPEMESVIYPEGDIEYSYFQAIEPGKTNTVTFHMQAIRSGVFSGDIAFYIQRAPPRSAKYFCNVTLEIIP